MRSPRWASAAGAALLADRRERPQRPAGRARPRSSAGSGSDSAWTDDLHHALHAAITGERDGYYADFGTLAQLAKALRQGFVYDGCWSDYRERRHGAPPIGLDGRHFVVFAQNHDQVGNRALGERLSQIVDLERQKLAAGVDPALALRAAALHGRGVRRDGAVPVLHGSWRRAAQRRRARGPGREFAAFARSGDLLDPHDPEAFARSRLDWTLREQGQHAQLLDLYRELLALDGASRRWHGSRCETPSSRPSTMPT